MSLINQVLLDLDRRHAVRGAQPLASTQAARAGVAPGAGGRVGALGAAALTVALVAAAALVWGRVGASPTSAAASTTRSSAAPMAAATAPRAGADANEAAPSNFAMARADGPSTVVDFSARNDAPVDATAPSFDAVSTSATPIVAAAPARPDAPPAVAAPLAPSPGAGAMPPLVAAAPARVEKIVPPLTSGERADADYRRGIELHGQGRGADAEAAFAAALQQDARLVPARQALAVEWIGRGRADEAERLLRDGLGQDAHQPPLAIVLARVQAERHDLRGGIETLRASLGGRATTPEQAEARALMATLQQSAGQHREAIEAFGEALRQAPQNGAWWVGLGLSLAADGRPESASQAFERARATGTLAPELLQYVEQRLRAPAP